MGKLLLLLNDLKGGGPVVRAGHVDAASCPVRSAGGNVK